jgi:hypothetical protein
VKCRTTTARERPPPAAKSDSIMGRSFVGGKPGGIRSAVK